MIVPVWISPQNGWISERLPTADECFPFINGTILLAAPRKKPISPVFHLAALRTFVPVYDPVQNRDGFEATPH
jgi:hypothetical protein